MFCENCGAKIDDDSKFCTECGAAINSVDPPKDPSTQNPAPSPASERNLNASPPEAPVRSFAPTQATVQTPPNNYTYAQVPSYAPAPAGFPMQPAKPKKHFPLWAILTICISAVVIVALILFFVIASGASKPEKTVEKYFKAVTSQNYASSYDMLNYENKDFTSKDAYIAFMKLADESKTSSEKKATITDYKIYDSRSVSITDISDIYPASEVLDEYVENFGNNSTSSKSSITKQNDETQRYYIAYKLSNSKTNKIMTVRLKKQPSKQFLFFDTYKIDGSSDLAKDCTITVPPSSKITMDGKAIPETYLVKDDTDTDSIYLKYKLPAVFRGNHKFTITAPYMENISQTNSISGSENYSFTNFTFNSDTKLAISKKSNELIPKLLEASGAQKPFDEFEQYCSSDTSSTNSLKAYYEYLEKALKAQNITDLKMSNLEQSSSGNYSTSSQIAYYDRYIASYKFTYADGDRDMRGSIKLIYVFENNDWKIKEAY